MFCVSQSLRSLIPALTAGRALAIYIAVLGMLASGCSTQAPRPDTKKAAAEPATAPMRVYRNRAKTGRCVLPPHQTCSLR